MSIRSVVKRTSPLVDSILRPPTGITILIYHRVGGGSTSAVDLDVDEFRRQLEHLREHHDVIDLDTAVSRLESNEVATTSGVVLTFDDGTADFCDVVVPELVDASVPATLYVTTGFVDDPQGFHWDTPAVSWSGLGDAVSTGLVTIGSHSHSHALFDRIGPTQAADEIARSIDAIGDNVGVAAEHFAYPKALRASAGIEPIVCQSFTTAAVARGRVNRPERCDLHRLTRTPVQRGDGPTEFAAKASGGMRLEGELRELVARRRYRNAVN